MAFLGNRILLGFEDEPITEKYVEKVDHTTNKVGGRPDWTGYGLANVPCKLCGMSLPLLMQIYAPLKHSQYHRTLYIFACVNSSCWNQSESWVCLRGQKLSERERPVEVEEMGPEPSFWCGTSEVWEDEENGNVVDQEGALSELSRGLSVMSVDGRNNGNGSEGATGTVPTALAMIEGDEGEVVCVETPTSPQDNLVALMEQAMALPQVPDSKLEFSPFFIYVEEEDLCRIGAQDKEIVMSRLRDYKRQEEEEETMACGESYEKSLPSHGDKMFHQFLTRIQASPGQIIRYGGYPLWLYPEEKSVGSCRHCGGETAFEIQILPTVLEKLWLAGNTGHLEFGSVYIFSCLQGCWDPSTPDMRHEIVIVQREK